MAFPIHLYRVDASSSICETFPTHRAAMNALYCLLCEIIFETHDLTSYREFRVRHQEHLVGGLAHGMCQIARTLDFTTSNMLDVYTFSLAEALLQLVSLYQSDAIFHCILDTLWPQLEIKGKGLEHSHYPTHLAKRIITQIAAYWAQARVVNPALPAVRRRHVETEAIRHQPSSRPCGLRAQQRWESFR